jgi:hypothetical protein
MKCSGYHGSDIWYIRRYGTIEKLKSIGEDTNAKSIKKVD